MRQLLHGFTPDLARLVAYADGSNEIYRDYAASFIVNPPDFNGPYGIGGGPTAANVKNGARCGSCGGHHWNGARCVHCGTLDDGD